MPCYLCRCLGAGAPCAPTRAGGFPQLRWSYKEQKWELLMATAAAGWSQLWMCWAAPQWHQPVFPPLHGTAQGTQGPPLTRDRAQTRSCWARWDNSMAKATIRQMLFSNPADPSQWKHPGAARRAAACLEKTQVAAQASQLSVLGVARTAPQRLWRSPAPVNATEQTL